MTWSPLRVYLYAAPTLSCAQHHKQIDQQLAGRVVTNPQDAELIVVLGGDGWILQAIRHLHHLWLTFYGSNCGHLGFLLNHHAQQVSLPDTMNDLHLIDLPLLRITTTHTDGTASSDLIVNDVQIGHLIADYYLFSIQTATETIECEGTGLVVATPVGTTGYTAGLGYPILPLQSDQLLLGGIATAPFTCTTLAREQITIQVERVRERVDAYLDGHGAIHTDIKQVEIAPSNLTVQLAFDAQTDFLQRRELLAEHKRGNL